MARCFLPTLALAYVLGLGASAAHAETVGHVIDGDTIELAGGQRVRLLQLDATELGSGECYSRKAAQVLRSLLPEGTTIRLEADPSLDQVDQYGRLLRYIHRGSLNVNLELVRRGAATVWFYDGERGNTRPGFSPPHARHAAQGGGSGAPAASYGTRPARRRPQGAAARRLPPHHRRPSRAARPGIRATRRASRSSMTSTHRPQRRELRTRGIRPEIARRRTGHGSGLGRYRYVIERTFAGLHQFNGSLSATTAAPRSTKPSSHSAAASSATDDSETHCEKSS